MNLFKNYIVSEQDNVRAVKDRRFRVKSVIVSYTGEDGHEYRKRFEAKGEPIIPERGTHEQLNAIRKQF
jgi:hypothetical protein